MPTLPKSHTQLLREKTGQVTDCQRRGSAHSRGYDGKWRKASRLHLMSEPLCRHCRAAGIIKAAAVVDHIIPHRGNQSLFWDEKNWQSLCVPCHNTKTATGG